MDNIHEKMYNKQLINNFISVNNVFEDTAYKLQRESEYVCC